jgi:hypothetical protein
MRRRTFERLQLEHAKHVGVYLRGTAKRLGILMR